MNILKTFASLVRICEASRKTAKQKFKYLKQKFRDKNDFIMSITKYILGW